MSLRAESFSRYLPADQKTRNWGWRLLDAGRQNIPPNATYPVGGHPVQYRFDKTGKRTLNEFQVIFIATGCGSFESAGTRSCPVRSGDVLLLFPGEWHRYRPALEAGWSEYWLGFRGQDAERVMTTFFKKSEPVLKTSQTNEIMRLFDQLLDLAKNPFPGAEQVMASYVPMILAYLHAGRLQRGLQQQRDSQRILEAKSSLLKNIAGRTDLNKLARSLGMSYSKFRTLFKQHTGYPPREFENIVKLNRACDLLSSGHYSVSQTAEELGYGSIYYFSRAFKRQFGSSPQAWLKDHQGH